MKKTLSNQKKVNQSNVKKTEMVDLELIDIENSIPGRAAYNQQALKEYTTKWKGGSNPPPVVLYTEDEKTFWVADGFHRIKSLKEANVEVNKIQAIVNRGGNREALLHALGANAEQGVRKTKKDKRHAVEIMLTDPEWVKWSNTVIARKVGVEETLVRSRRKAIFGLTDDTSEERMFFRNGAIHKQKVKTSRKSSQVASQPKEDGSDEDAQEQVKMLEFKISRLELTINQLEEENYEKKEEVKTLEQNNAILTQEKQLLEQQLERSHIIQLKAEANLKDQEINNLKNGYGILYKFAEEKLSEVEDLKHQLNNLHQQVENLKNQLSQLWSWLSGLNFIHKHLTTHAANLDSQLKNQKSETKVWNEFALKLWKKLPGVEKEQLEQENRLPENVVRFFPYRKDSGDIPHQQNTSKQKRLG